MSASGRPRVVSGAQGNVHFNHAAVDQLNCFLTISATMGRKEIEGNSIDRQMGEKLKDFLFPHILWMTFYCGSRWNA